MMFGYGGHWAFWQVAFMSVAMIAFWGLLIWVFLNFAKSNNPVHHHHDNDARQILDQRLARGELDAEEYRRLVDTLNHDNRVGSAGISG